MDVKMIGIFLGQLRKEKGFTQEQLGEKLGVTNKTVSRWENGNYLPPVEILQCLSEMYGISINEILSGERLEAKKYKEKAEENIKSVLSESTFTLKERVEFYKNKWLKDHFWTRMIARILIFLLLGASLLTKRYIWAIGYGLASIIYYLVERNLMMAYVECRAFDGSGR